ncbi:MAG: hypothetical protein WA104_02005 [Thermodesulfovibrionales bacterium]
MKNVKKCVILFFSLLHLTACAGTSLYSVRNEEFSHNKYKNLIIFIPESDIALRAVFEDAFVEHFSQSSIKAVSSLKLFPPVTDYSNSDLNRKLIDNNIDGAIILKALNANTNSLYIPPSSSTMGSGMVMGNTMTYQSQTSQSPGFNVFQTTVTFNILLVDVKASFESEKLKIVWTATAYSKDNLGLSTVDLSAIANTLAENIVYKLIEENIVDHK